MTRKRNAPTSAELDLLLEKRNVGVVGETGLASHVFLNDRPLRGLLTVLRRGYDLVIDTE